MLGARHWGRRESQPNDGDGGSWRLLHLRYQHVRFVARVGKRPSQYGVYTSTFWYFTGTYDTGIIIVLIPWYLVPVCTATTTKA